LHLCKTSLHATRFELLIRHGCAPPPSLNIAYLAIFQVSRHLVDTRTIKPLSCAGPGPMLSLGTSHIDFGGERGTRTLDVGIMSAYI
jgi:hypothetical protein